MAIFDNHINRKLAVCLDNASFGRVSPDVLDQMFGTYSYNGKYVSMPISDLNYAITLEHKITFLLTSIKRCHISYNDYAAKCLRLLEKLLPNARFDLSGEPSLSYSIDLCQQLWGEDGFSSAVRSNPPGVNLLDEYTMREFLCRGIVIWGNTTGRDRVEEEITSSMTVLAVVSREADF